MFFLFVIINSVIIKIKHIMSVIIAALDLRRKRYERTQIITNKISAFIFWDLLSMRLMNVNGIRLIKYSEAKFLIPSVEPGLGLGLRFKKLKPNN